MSVSMPQGSGWKIKPLGEVFEVIGGGTPSKQEPSYYGGDIPWATIRDMHSSHLSSTEHSITKLGLENSSSKLIPAGEVIMASRVGLGKSSILMQDTAINQDIRALIPRRRSSVDRKFLLHWLQSVAGEIVAAGTGATVQGVTLPFIKSLPFPDTSIGEQKRIVAVLDQAFAALDRARANAKANLGNASHLRVAAMEQLFPNDDKIAAGNSLDELCEAIVDCEHKTAPNQERGIPSIRTPNIGKGVLLLNGVNRVSEETYREWTRRAEPRAGDLILAREAPAGNVAVIPEGMRVCLGQRTVLLRPKMELLVPAYLAHLLLRPSSQERLLAHSRGATVQHINVKDIRAFRVSSLPALAEQRAVVRGVEGLMAQEQSLINAYIRKLADIAALRQSLLQAAFSGQLA